MNPLPDQYNQAAIPDEKVFVLIANAQVGRIFPDSEERIRRRRYCLEVPPESINTKVGYKMPGRRQMH